MKKIICLLLAFILVFSVSGCKKTEEIEGKYVKLTLDEGYFIIELYPDVAPKTVKHFLETVASGYYEGKVFHRTIPGLIQGGSADGQGIGGSGKTVKGEFMANGVKNNLSHERGVVSMARAQDYDSASAQFFIMTAPVSAYDGQYAAFGRVVEGLEYADRIAARPVGGIRGDELIEKPVIVKAEILKDYTPQEVTE